MTGGQRVLLAALTAGMPPGNGRDCGACPFAGAWLCADECLADATAVRELSPWPEGRGLPE